MGKTYKDMSDKRNRGFNNTSQKTPPKVCYYCGATEHETLLEFVQVVNLWRCVSEKRCNEH